MEGRNLRAASNKDLLAEYGRPLIGAFVPRSNGVSVVLMTWEGRSSEVCSLEVGFRKDVPQ